MMSFFAPASMCAWALSRLVKIPVHSYTTSTFRSPQGSLEGSRSEVIWIASPLTIILSPSTDTSPGKRPCTESYLVRCARSEEHTSELQSRGHLVCRLLLETKQGNHLQAAGAMLGRSAPQLGDHRHRPRRNERADRPDRRQAAARPAHRAVVREPAGGVRGQ